MIKITFTQRGSFDKTERFLRKLRTLEFKQLLQSCGQEGVNALAAATPVDTGLAASSWDYKVSTTSKGLTITWTNSNNEGGVPVVILIQYGHATRNGSFVQGRDFINPAMRPVFDSIASKIWKEVTRV